MTIGSWFAHERRAPVSSPTIAMGVVVVVLASGLASRPSGSVVTLEVDIHARIGRVRPIWDETDMWKIGSLYGASHPDPARWGAAAGSG